MESRMKGNCVRSPFVQDLSITLRQSRIVHHVGFPESHRLNWAAFPFFAHSLTQQAAGLSIAPSVYMKTRLRQSCMPLHVAYIESQAVYLQCSMYFCHHATFCLCSSASLVLQMLHSVKAV